MAESYENFIKSLELPPTGFTSAAFTAYQVINLFLLVVVTVPFVGVVAVEMVVFNATAPFAVRFVVRKVIMLLPVMTVTLIPQNLSTL
jgi:hypothetical protein